MTTEPSRGREQEDERMWEEGWEGHQIALLRRLARLSFREKLDWLEEAHRLVIHLTGSRRSGDNAAGSD